jgi:RNA polymerase II subunit A-like phosphatase
VKEFLERAHELYELHIYTMGTRTYAEAIAKLIDPESRYFHDRIVTRDHHGSNK